MLARRALLRARRLAALAARRCARGCAAAGPRGAATSRSRATARGRTTASELALRAGRRPARRRRRRSRSCTARSARTARSRGCSSCSTCRTSARACWPRRCAWTRSLLKDLMAAAGLPQVRLRRRARARWREDRTRCAELARARAAGVRQAGAARLVGRHRARSTSAEELERGARARRSRTTRGSSSRRTATGLEVECSVLGQTRRRGLASRARSSLARRRLVRLRGEVQAGRDGAASCRRGSPTTARERVRALARRGVPARRAAPASRASTSSSTATTCCSTSSTRCPGFTPTSVYAKLWERQRRCRTRSSSTGCARSRSSATARARGAPLLAGRGTGELGDLDALGRPRAAR